MSALTIPSDAAQITPQWLTRVLAEQGLLGGAGVTACSADAIAEGKGFMNRLFRLSLEYDAGSGNLPGRMIAKLPTNDASLRTVSDRLGQNRREVWFYRELAGNPHLPAPQCYHSAMDADNGATLLLLEDMGYARQGDSVTGCTLNGACSAMTQLARFHALWWNSGFLNKSEWLPSKEAEVCLYQAIYPDAWKSLIEQAGDGMPAALRRLGDRLVEDVPKIKGVLAAPPATVLHGDFRLDNCFFRTEAGCPPVVVIDWEFCARGRGTCDAATFISEAFPPHRRREVESILLRTYHSALVAAGVSGYSFEECWRDYRLAMLEIFVFWIITGGYCNFDGERATVYLHNTLARFDAAIADLDSMDPGLLRIRAC